MEGGGLVGAASRDPPVLLTEDCTKLPTIWSGLRRVALQRAYLLWGEQGQPVEEELGPGTGGPSISRDGAAQSGDPAVPKTLGLRFLATLLPLWVFTSSRGSGRLDNSQ